MIEPSFHAAISRVGERLRTTSYSVHPKKWQGVDVSAKPEAEMREIYGVHFEVPLWGRLELSHWRYDIQPNMPWADEHFEERVCGQPLNPGETWKSWPWALAADKHRTEGEAFSHSYMERYWPVYANTGPHSPHRGIRYVYGDLNDVVRQLRSEPETRQAYLPVFFPEDTGATHGGRVPCTLGYHWLQRNRFLHTTYYIRSCDYFRHFRDDLYLTLRLTFWLLDQLRLRDREWNKVEPGLFRFDCASMHLFINDFRQIFGEPTQS